MRILLACHEPPRRDGAALDPGQLAAVLMEAGHSVRGWDASETVFDDGLAPRLTPGPGGPHFAELTSTAIDNYLNAARRQLDELVRWFDPDVIHTDYLWILAYLALESGVPYVASVRGPELDAYRADPRYDAWIQQAAENAGRLFVSNSAVRVSLNEAFFELESPIELLRANRDALGSALTAAYARVRENRCGLVAARG